MPHAPARPLLLAGLAVALAAAAPAPVTPDDLAALVLKERRNHQARQSDAAAPGPDLSAAGQPFRFMIPATATEAHQRGRTLTLALTPQTWRPADLQEFPHAGALTGHGFVVRRTDSQAEPYSAGNGLGIRRQVRGRRVVILAVAAFSPAVPQLPAREGEAYQAEVAAAPGARDRYSFVVEGRLAPINQRMIACGRRHDQPTLLNRKELRENYCVVGAEIARLALVETASGRVVKDWR